MVNPTDTRLVNGDEGQEDWNDNSNEQAKNSARLSFKVDLPEASKVFRRSVDYEIKPLGVNAIDVSDYVVAAPHTKPKGTLRFPVGSTSQTLWIDPVDDTLAEYPESFELVLSNPQPSGTLNKLEFPDLDGDGQPDTTISVPGTIYSDDSVQLTAKNVKVTEGEIADIEVTLGRVLGQGEAVAVRVRVAHGDLCRGSYQRTASRSDYRATDAILLHFGPGESMKRISIPTFDDILDEEHECVNIILEDGQQATIVGENGVPSTISGRNSLLVNLRILDNDDPPSLSISPIGVQELDPRDPADGKAPYSPVFGALRLSCVTWLRSTSPAVCRSRSATRRPGVRDRRRVLKAVRTS